VIDQSLIIAAAILLAMLIATAALMRGWRGWLELKRAELETSGAVLAGRASPHARIELADLKERVRRLEAIADGTEN